MLNRCVSCGADLTERRSFPVPRNLKNNRLCADCWIKEPLALELREVCETITRGVCDIRGRVYQSDLDRLQVLHRITGMDWDAVNAKWNPWAEGE
jgi:hypothetical protein